MNESYRILINVDKRSRHWQVQSPLLGRATQNVSDTWFRAFSLTPCYFRTAREFGNKLASFIVPNKWIRTTEKDFHWIRWCHRSARNPLVGKVLFKSSLSIIVNIILKIPLPASVWTHITTLQSNNIRIYLWNCYNILPMQDFAKILLWSSYENHSFILLRLLISLWEIAYKH